jgi:hypothetical protein
MIDYWFRCPKCGKSGIVDEDQAVGKASTWCFVADGGCGFHAVVVISPLIPVTKILTKNQTFVIREP